MSVTEQSVEQLKEEVGNLVGPFFDKYNGLNAEIKKREKRIEEIKKEITELRGARSYLRTIVRNINPDLIPSIHQNGRRPGRPKRKGATSTRLGPDRTQQLTDWLQAHRDELNANGGFRSSDLSKRDDLPFFIHPSSVSKALINLHEGGVLHLDHWTRGRDYPDRPAGKFYKVV